MVAGRAVVIGAWQGEEDSQCGMTVNVGSRSGNLTLMLALTLALTRAIVHYRTDLKKEMEKVWVTPTLMPTLTPTSTLKRQTWWVRCVVKELTLTKSVYVMQMKRETEAVDKMEEFAKSNAGLGLGLRLGLR